MSDDVCWAGLERENELRRRIRRSGTGLLVGCFEMGFSYDRGGFVSVYDVTGTAVPVGVVTSTASSRKLETNGWVD